MPRNPSARRVHRQDTGPDDAFVAGILETTAWAQQHRNQLIIGTIIAVVTIVALVVVMTSRGNRRAAAVNELTQVRAVALSGNNQLAIRDLEQFMTRFGSTPSADEARLMLARAYMQEGQSQKAVETVDDLARDVKNVLGVNAAFLQAAAHEAAGETARAEEIYLRIGEGAEFLYQKQEGLDNAARVRLERGNAAGAVELYDRILALTPETDQNRPVYELRAGEARAVAATATAASPGN